MRITVLLGGPLRNEAGKDRQELELEIVPGTRIEDILDQLRLPVQRVKMIMLNGLGSTPDAVIQDGDRVAFFPPELAFNTFVSLGFRKESVEKRRN